MLLIIDDIKKMYCMLNNKTDWKVSFKSLKCFDQIINCICGLRCYKYIYLLKFVLFYVIKFISGLFFC